jgi:formylmethanofuran dehydrogenase subunit E-like metal-binding protein
MVCNLHQFLACQLVYIRMHNLGEHSRLGLYSGYSMISGYYGPAWSLWPCLVVVTRFGCCDPAWSIPAWSLHDIYKLFANTTRRGNLDG